MPIDRFINERKNVWQRLEDLLRLLDRMTLRKLHREEVRELGRIYRRTASGPGNCPGRIARPAAG